MLLLCSIILVQTVYAIENISENQSTNKDNINKNGYFAEKNHIIYYMKYVKIEENHEALQLYQYDLQTQIASPLCKDYFQYDPIAPIYNMRVCNDGYVYFKAQREEIKEEEQKSGYYRVSVNGGKSEYVCKYEEIAKFKLKIFNFGWWRNPPYKNDDFRHRVQLSQGSENQILH